MFPEGSVLSEGEDVAVGEIVVVPVVVQPVHDGHDPDVVIGRCHLLRVINSCNMDKIYDTISIIMELGTSALDALDKRTKRSMTNHWL